MNAEALKKDFLPKYLATGESRFYKFLLFYSVNKLVYMNKFSHSILSPELEFLDYHDQLVILYKREGEKFYLDLSRIFRKAAHKIYRSLLKKNLTTKNSRFLNLV